jgi:hypothetical protein
MARFDDAMMRHDAESQRRSEGAAVMAARERQEAERHVLAFEQSLRDLARYLLENHATRYKHSVGLFKSPHPEGFVISMTRAGATSRGTVNTYTSLTSDGRLYRYVGNPRSGYVETSADALLQRRISLGTRTVCIHDGDLHVYCDGTYSPYFDYLAELARQLLQQPRGT